MTTFADLLLKHLKEIDAEEMTILEQSFLDNKNMRAAETAISQKQFMDDVHAHEQPLEVSLSQHNARLAEIKKRFADANHNEVEWTVHRLHEKTHLSR